MLDIRRVYAMHFLIRLRKNIAEVPKWVGEAHNFLRIVIGSTLYVFHDVCHERNIGSNVCEILPLFPFESKIWIVVYGEETISCASGDRI